MVFAVKKDHRFIGHVIYHDYDTTSIEIGWVLEPSCWGQGIASLLTAKMIEKAKQAGRHAVIECVPEQKGSMRIAKKFGFRNQGIIDGLLVFRL